MSMGIFGGLGGSIDSFLGTYVNSVSTNVATGIAPIVTTGFTIWVMLYGYAVMRQEVSDPINAFIRSVLKFSFIFGIALSGGVYQSVIIDSISSLQDGLVNLVTPSSGIVSVSGNNVYQLLDDLTEKGFTMGLFILDRGTSLLPLGGYLDLIAGLLVLTGNTVLLIVCGGFVLMTKVAIAFIMGIGPLFIACLAFPPIAKFFDAWLSKATNYILLTVVLSFSIGLSISICDSYLTNAITQGGVLTEPVNQITEAFSLIVLYGALLFLIYQSPQLASGLAGGASLSGGGIAQLAVGAMLGRIGSKGDNSNDQKKGGGGSIEGKGSPSDNNGGSGNGSGGGGQSPSRAPAYRRISRGRYGSGK